MNRETVIKALRCCLIPGCGSCEACPLNQIALCQAQLGNALLKLLGEPEEPKKKEAANHDV